jgi:glycosyltransferase involved in cell wall biosynthesis
MRPRIVTASAIDVHGYSTMDFTDSLFTLAAFSEVRRFRKKIDLIYAHFFYPAGLAAARCSKVFGLPYIVAHGDDDIDARYHANGGKHFKDISGVIAVSARNRRFCENAFSICSSKIEVFPNGVDNKLFCIRDKNIERQKLSLELEDFIIAFVGHLIPRKGPDRVVSAVEGLPRTKVLLIGEGPIKLVSNQVVACGAIGHEELPRYLAAADIFVLPTTGEGSCNSIIEAMACGLPVVSSSGDYNDEILNDKVSIRVDPMNTNSIREAIIELMQNPTRRRKMSKSALQWSKKFAIEKRASGITKFIEKQISSNGH